ncbi:hypothetical protein IT417_01495 [bacterium]|nr:hypothetical protein [bacterium]
MPDINEVYFSDTAVTAGRKIHELFDFGRELGDETLVGEVVNGIMAVDELIPLNKRVFDDENRALFKTVAGEKSIELCQTFPLDPLRFSSNFRLRNDTHGMFRVIVNAEYAGKQRAPHTMSVMVIVSTGDVYLLEVKSKSKILSYDVSHIPPQSNSRRLKRERQ